MLSNVALSNSAPRPPASFLPACRHLALNLGIRVRRGVCVCVCCACARVLPLASWLLGTGTVLVQFRSPSNHFCAPTPSAPRDPDRKKREAVSGLGLRNCGARSKPGRRPAWGGGKSPASPPGSWWSRGAGGRVRARCSATEWVLVQFSVSVHTRSCWRSKTVTS